MNKKRIISILLSGVVASTFLAGCGCNTAEGAREDVEEGVEDVKEGTKDTAEEIKEAGKSLYDKVKDTTMDYNRDNLVTDLNNKGLKTEEIDNTNASLSEKFSAQKTTYKVEGGTLYIYEYDTTADQDMIREINSISDDGKTINKDKINWDTQPHIYKKGRILAIYDGDNQNVLDDLKYVLNDPIVG